MNFVREPMSYCHQVSYQGHRFNIRDTGTRGVGFLHQSHLQQVTLGVRLGGDDTLE